VLVQGAQLKRVFLGRLWQVGTGFLSLASHVFEERSSLAHVVQHDVRSVGIAQRFVDDDERPCIAHAHPSDLVHQNERSVLARILLHLVEGRHLLRARQLVLARGRVRALLPRASGLERLWVVPTFDQIDFVKDGVKIGLLPENRSGNKNTYLFRTKLIGFYY